MVSTVTVCTATIVAGSGLAIGAAILCTIFLIGFLTTKELARTSSGNKMNLLSKSVSIGIIPLLICFCVTVALKIVEILS